MRRNSADTRARLHAIAQGRPAEPVSSERVIDPDMVAANAEAFGAWARFARACTEGFGEPLSAPAELLAPLP